MAMALGNSVLAAPAAVLLEPEWKALSAEQQLALAPLSGEWDQMDDLRRHKWRVIAGRYPTMKPEEQRRVQAQMLTWAKLSASERQHAREKFRIWKSAPTDMRGDLKQKWAEYQALPEEEKARLKVEAAKRATPKAKPLASSPAGGGALPEKPLTQKLATPRHPTLGEPAPRPPVSTQTTGAAPLVLPAPAIIGGNGSSFPSASAATGAITNGPTGSLPAGTPSPNAPNASNAKP